MNNANTHTMKNFSEKYQGLIGKDIYVSGWQRDNSGELLSGVVENIKYAYDFYGCLMFKVSTSDDSVEIGEAVLNGLVTSGSYRANRLLDSGTNAIIKTL